MARVQALRVVAAVLLFGVAVVAALGIVGPTVTAGADGCAAVSCPAEAPAEPQTALPCLHDPGCGGGGLAAGLVLVAVLAAAPLVLPPRVARWPSVSPLAVSPPALLLACGPERPPRLAVV